MLDTQVVYRDLKSQIALMRATNELNRIIDSRRLKRLTIAQQAKIRRHFEIHLLHQKLQSLRRIFRNHKQFISNMKETSLYHEYRKIYLVHRNAIRRREQKFLKKIIARYKIKQSIIDIQRQLRELSITKEKETRTKDYVFVKRVCVIEALFIFVIDFSKEKCQRREVIVNVLTILCQLQKNHDFRCKKNSSTIKSKCEKIAQIIVQRSSLFVSLSIECSSTQCIFCLDNKALSTLKRQ